MPIAAFAARHRVPEKTKKQPANLLMSGTAS